MPASIKHLTDKKLNLTSLLARWKDGLYYTAAIVKCDKANKRCLVCFEDDSEVWINNRDVHIQLTLDQLNEDEDIVCCICDDGHSESPNEIILCDVCNQGYHQKCHTPPVDSSKIDESEDTNDHKDWFCATCSYILNQSNRAKLSSSVQPQNQVAPQPQPKSKQVAATPQRQQPQRQPPPQTSSTPPTSRHSAATRGPVVAATTSQPGIPNKAPQSKPTTVTQRSPSPKISTTVASNVTTTSSPTSTKQPVKVKQTPTNQQLRAGAASVGPAKSANSLSNQRPTPYYPLSNQVRATATSTSSAGLVSMSAGSAMVVGSSAGRTKQEIVQQSNKSSQQRLQRQSGASVVSSTISGGTVGVERPTGTPAAVVSSNSVGQSTPIKHAVRKSSVNFSPMMRQSALPTATRSVLPASGVTSAPGPQVTPPKSQLSSSSGVTIGTNSTPITSNSQKSNSNHSGTNDTAAKVIAAATTSVVQMSPQPSSITTTTTRPEVQKSVISQAPSASKLSCSTAGADPKLTPCHANTGNGPTEFSTVSASTNASSANSNNNKSLGGVKSDDSVKEPQVSVITSSSNDKTIISGNSAAVIVGSSKIIGNVADNSSA